MLSQGLEMERVNEYRFYELGKKIRGVQGLDDETTYQSVFWSLWHARIALVELKTDPVAMRVSLPAVDKMINAITEIVPEDFTSAIAKSRDATTTIGFGAFSLTEALKEFEPVMAAECNALDTYVVSQKRGYSTPDLVERCERMLPVETVALLEPTVVADIRSAGRCLAFDVPTAAGFHILRALEAVMAMYYRHLTGKELQKRNRNWALYLKKVKEVGSHSAKIYGALDHIRDNYRNPITHPEDTLTEGEAVMLFGLSLSVIELMAEALRTLPPALSELEELKALTEIAEEKAAGSGAADF